MSIRPKAGTPAKISPLRSERGESAKNYEESVAKHSKNLRCQFGTFYDAKKVRNI